MSVYDLHAQPKKEEEGYCFSYRVPTVQASSSQSAACDCRFLSPVHML